MIVVPDPYQVLIDGELKWVPALRVDGKFTSVQYEAPTLDKDVARIRSIQIGRALAIKNKGVLAKEIEDYRE